MTTHESFGTHKQFLEFYIKQTNGNIIEFGTGDMSTGLILNVIKGTTRKLVSVENNKDWYSIQNNTTFNPKRWEDDYDTWNEITKKEFNKHYLETQKRINLVING